VPEFVEEALKARQVAAGLTNVLKLMPQTTMEQLSARFQSFAVCVRIPNMWRIWRAIWAKRPFSISGARCAAAGGRGRGDGRAAEQARSGIGHGISAGPDERFSADIAKTASCGRFPPAERPEDATSCSS